MVVPEPPPSEVLPVGETPKDCWIRMRELAYPHQANGEMIRKLRRPGELIQEVIM
jgi:hypothetical protein